MNFIPVKVSVKLESYYLMGQSTLQHTVSGNLAQITRAELPQLGCDSILFH